MTVEKKVTEFTGYVSGDYECFCLSKITFKKWRKAQDDSVLLYPNEFFSDKMQEGKWKFKITVEAEKVKK